MVGEPLDVGQLGAAVVVSAGAIRADGIHTLAAFSFAELLVHVLVPSS